MKWSFTSIGLIIFGLIGILVITFFNEIVISNEQDYFTLKEAVEASMIESVDVTYYRLTGDIKISQEKFVENLTRRFVESATYGDENYKLEFYDISESPPKVSVRIVDATKNYNLYGTFGAEPTQVKIVNQISGILDVYTADSGGADGNNGGGVGGNNTDGVPKVPVKDLEKVTDKVYKYEDDYYKIPDGSKLGDGTGGEECEVHADTLVCDGVNGSESGKVELPIIPDDDLPKYGIDVGTDPDDSDDSNNSGDSDEDEELVELEFISLSNVEVQLRVNYTFAPKYKKAIYYNGYYYLPVDKLFLNDNVVVSFSGGSIEPTSAIKTCYAKSIESEKIECYLNKEKSQSYVFKKDVGTKRCCYYYYKTGTTGTASHVGMVTKGIRYNACENFLDASKNNSSIAFNCSPSTNSAELAGGTRNLHITCKNGLVDGASTDVYFSLGDSTPNSCG